MKRRILKYIVTALIAYSVLSFSAAQEPIRLTTKIWPPYQYYNETDGKLTGVSVNVISCAFNLMDIPFTIQVLPWVRAQKYVKTGKSDGFFSASRHSNRDEYAVRSIDIADQNWSWYTPTDYKISPSDPKFKEHARIVAILGSNMTKWLKTEGYQVKDEVAKTENMIQMLMFGRADAFMENELVVDHLLQVTGSNHSLVKTIERRMPVGVYFSKKTLNNNPQLLEKFNRYVPECRLKHN